MNDERSRDGPPLPLEGGDGLGWLGIVRLGLVQAGIGAVVVLATSTLSRLMTVELAWPALVPGALVALHYLVQVLRPRFGHGGDRGGRRSAWIVGGMAATAAGGWLAACGVAVGRSSPLAGAGLMAIGFVALGLGVSACGANQLAWLSEAVAPAQRGAAAALGWFLMMVGFIVSAGVAGAALRPYSPLRLVETAAGVGLAAVMLAVAGVAGLKEFTNANAPPPPIEGEGKDSFLPALRAVWAEDHTRRFAGVVFLAMLAYAGQELVLEPLAGAVFGMTPGASTQLMGLQRGGVLAGMAAVGLFSGLGRTRLSAWMGWGCLGAATALAALAFGALRPTGFPLLPVVFGLGLADGVFAVAAVGAMMGGAGREPGAGTQPGAGSDGHAGVRVGVWGAAQAVAYACGGLLATGALQAGRAYGSGGSGGYAASFALQAGLFVLAAALGARRGARRAAPPARSPGGVVLEGQA